jgi:formylmethanofuran dehydrogenase subunit E
MDAAEFVRCGTLMHGHPCPPLVLGVRAGILAMRRLGVGRAVERELFAFVELGSDHYAQGFADGIQIVTGCTFGKELILRLPHGKAGVRLVDQVFGRGVRVSAREETISRIEDSDWFRACVDRGGFGAGCDNLAGGLSDEILAGRDDVLFTVSEVFPLKIHMPEPRFESAACEACGERALVSHLRNVRGRRVCVECEERCLAQAG